MVKGRGSFEINYGHGQKFPTRPVAKPVLSFRINLKNMDELEKNTKFNGKQAVLTSQIGPDGTKRTSLTAFFLWKALIIRFYVLKTKIRVGEDQILTLPFRLRQPKGYPTLCLNLG
jgi:hypothetical protein